MQKRYKIISTALTCGLFFAGLTNGFAQEATTKDAQKASQPDFSIRYKGVTIKPGGWVAGVAIWRQRNATSDNSTNFGTIPLPGTANYYMSEWRETARNTRGSVMVTGTQGKLRGSGYMEFDFGAAAPNANESQSNSFSPRLRQGYAELRYDHKWYLLGGQVWSLLTSNRTGIDPEQIKSPLVIDNQIMPGFTYARQSGFRITRNWNDKYALAIALENPETNASFGANVSALSTVNYNSLGSAFLGNNVSYSTDVAPDIIVKASVDGKYGHFEAKEVTRFFRDRITPTGATQKNGSYNDTRTGAAIGAFGLVHVLPKKLDVMAQGMYGNVNRYAGAGSLIDVTFRPNGTMAPLKGVQGWGGVEYRLTPKIDIFAYEGGDYVSRVKYRMADGSAMGYGNPLAKGSSFDNRLVYATSAGYAYHIYKGALGAFETDAVYTYIGRSTWQNQSGSAKANDNTAMIRFRYILP